MSKRQFSKKQKLALAMHSAWACSICGCPLPKNWHADHKIPFSKGGITDVVNGQATCPPCNLKKGNKLMRKIQLRDWQQDALDKAVKKFKKSQKLFLTQATPGGGKTIHGLSVFNELYAEGLVSHVVVLAPSTTLVRQWGDDAKKFYDIELKPSLIYRGESDYHEFKGIVLTYQGMNEYQENLRLFCESHDVLVIADEIHHVADGQSWGDAFTNAFEKSKNILALTGTPWASNGKRISYIEYDQDGYAKPDFGYVKKSAIADRVCRVTEFYRRSAVDLVFKDEQTGELAGEYQSLDEAIKGEIKGAYRKTLQSLKHFVSLFEEADVALSRIRRSGSRDAGGLIVAPDIYTAHKFQVEIQALTGEDYPIVHSKMQKPHEKISEFRTSDEKWLISVDMVTEGVDIKRLQVCIFLSAKNTELFLRQVIGRIERVRDKDSIIDQTGLFYYTDIPEINEIIDKLEIENKAGLALKEEECKSVVGSGTSISVEDTVILEDVSTAQNGLSANGFYFSNEVVAEAIANRRASPQFLGHVPLNVICLTVLASKQKVTSISEEEEPQSLRDVPLAVKKDRIRSRIAKEITRRLTSYLKRPPSGDEIKKAHTRINKASGISKTDDSVSYELFQRKLDYIFSSRVELWL